MAEIYGFEREPYRRRLEVEVLAVEEAGERTLALLDDTILYPEGGGQPADHGHLGDSPVVDVTRGAELGGGGEPVDYLRALARPR